jgi:predicted protein tyrosine phosphatase
MKRILFVCSQNRLRSLTAAEMFSQHPRLEVLSAGTDSAANTPLTSELVAWADVIVAMENAHKHKIFKRFKQQLAGKRVVVLGIPDEYEYMQPELVALLKSRLPRFVEI